MELGKARKVRGGHKGYVNKVIAQVNHVCQEYEGSPSQREHLLGLKSSLTEKVETIKKLDEQILEAVKEEDIEKEIDESGEFCESVYRCLAKIETCLGAHCSSVENDAKSTKSSQMQGPKLPKLTLKEFSGNPAKWQTFWDSFETAIHKNDQLSKIDKFNYLRGCLHGSAASAIEGISLTNSNYQVAVDILRERFANPQLLIASHMESLLKLPSVTEAKQLTKLRDLYDKIEVNVRSLDSLGIKQETYGSLLAPILMSKIPAELRLIISRGIGKEKIWKIDELLNVLKSELEARERCTTMKVSDSQDNNNTSAAHTVTRSKPERQYTASSLLVGKSQSIYCTFCRKQHPSVKCDVYCDSVSRRAIVRQKAKCFMCLKSGHMAKYCQSTRVCQNCAGKHHTALCDKVMSQPESKPQEQIQKTTESSSKSVSSPATRPTHGLNVCAQGRAPILLQTAVAPVSRPGNPEVKANVRIILDSGSQRSYVTHNLKEYLQLNTIGMDHLLIKTFGDETPRLKSCELVQLSITSIEGMELYLNAYSVPTICSPLSSQMVQLAVKEYPHLRDLELAEVPSSSNELKVDVLIGADYYWNFATGTTRRADIPGPVAMYTKLGWVLSGPVLSEIEANQDCSVQLSSTHILKVETAQVQLNDDEQVNMHEELKKFWDLESLGIANDEVSVYDKFTQSIQFKENRYEAELPFKEEHPLLPDNYSVCISRLNNLLARLRGKPEVLKEYNSIIEEQLKQGIVEVAPEESSEPGRVHYLPHREVIRMDKETTKLRIVYDASARCNGPSLNDCLLSGPSLSPLIFDILIRFRLNSIGMTADIEKAFLNISITPEHRDYLRFLWVDDPFSETPTVQQMRFNRVVFGVTSSPFILNATLRHHMNQYITQDAEFVKEMLRSLYVDDYASGANDTTSAFILSRKIRSTLAEGGFNMRKWTSNSQDLMDKWKESQEFPEITPSGDQKSPVVEEDQGYGQHLLNKESETTSTVLGQIWDLEEDEIKYDLEKPLADLESRATSKRTVLSIAAKFYDPLGLIAPVVLLFKLLFQKLCKNSPNWDDELDETLLIEWNSLILDLRSIKTISVKRCYCQHPLDTSVKSVELHVFSDASKKSYGSCVYVRCEHESDVHCSLIAAKTRVAPTSSITIPRLELLACLISAKLAHSLKEALRDCLKVNNVVYWTDSTVALSWIKGVTKEYKQFVQNRVTEIRRLTEIDCWRYCPTKENPADIASRGAKASELSAEEKWWHGPAYLLRPKEEWPEQPSKPISIEEGDPELKSKKVDNETQVLLASTADSPKPRLEELIKVSEYSSVLRLVRVTAYALRFVNNLKCRLAKHEPTTSELSVEEINYAEKLWIKEVQAAVKEKSTFQQVEKSLNLFKDENGILRCRGRLDNAPLPYDSRYPMLLPSNHEYTDLVIQLCHRAVMHNGVQETLAQLRSRFWVVKGRQVVKRVISKCSICKKLEGMSYATPNAPPLPEFRLCDDFAFSNVGVDYAGPLYVKDIYVKSESMNKAFIVIYTCASSRAVHLDLVPDASSSSFIRSFQRFIGRRGAPSRVLSDNSKTFKNTEVKNFVSSRGITWRYNVPRSPWWGGFFERLVRSVKRCLKKSLATARLSYEELLTLIIQIEGVLNSRPLTYVNEDGGEPLTPSHLVLGKRLLSTAPTHKGTMPSENLKSTLKRRKYLETVLAHFWKRWRDDYLTQLREHHRPSKKQGPTVRVGDVVCVKEDKIPRHNWSMARVQGLVTGKDGKVRAAVIKVHDKRGNLTQMYRPLQKLFPFELERTSKEEDDEEEPEVPITFVEHAEQENI